ncbi:unnamed protein product [Paramecium primaurelia]|uniref:Uncharacterized protein n=1 Tax=Paramecium primaurelia TaxID=5886 RepID=A0A8S1KNB0_PARPR|nr:unnamed protein product [Paramecium primaurelia]
MLSPEQIYSIVYKTDSGIEGYAIPRFYHDPAEMMRNRDLLKQIEKKQAHKRYETKKGSYLDDYTKMFKSYPSPLQYQSYSIQKVPDKNVKYPNRLTLFDQLQKEQKRINNPPVGAYNIEKTQEQIEKELKVLKTRKVKALQRPDPYEDAMAHSIMVPGPGNYNPHSFLPKIKVNNTKPEDWRKKHNIEKNKSLPQLPPVGTYTPILSDSFAKIQCTAPVKRSYWGSAKRFKGLFGNSSIGPGPGTYAQLSKLIAKGVEKSIYQD